MIACEWVIQNSPIGQKASNEFSWFFDFEIAQKYFLKIMQLRGENHFLVTSQCLPVYLKILILLFQDILTRCQFEITKKTESFRSFPRNQRKLIARL